jgi:hypothetical protein
MYYHLSSSIDPGTDIGNISLSTDSDVIALQEFIQHRTSLPLNFEFNRKFSNGRGFPASCKLKQILHDTGYVHQVIASDISWLVFVVSRLLLASLPLSSHKMSSERAAVRVSIVCPP